jgi:hypothetical protein
MINKRKVNDAFHKERKHGEKETWENGKDGPYVRVNPVKVNIPQCLMMCSQLPGVPNSRIF